MAQPLEDYALIGNTRTAALVGRDGSIDWLCLPRFDSPAVFAALLGGREHGRWLLAPKGDVRKVRRAYRDATLVLDTEFETAGGSVRVTDFMPHWHNRTELVRIVEGVSGEVAMRSEVQLRFGYGSIVPWVHQLDGGIAATAGPDSVYLRSRVPLRGEDFSTVAEFTMGKGQVREFVMEHYPSHEEPPLPLDPFAALEHTHKWWCDWSERSSYDGLYPEAVQRSLLTLKALTYGPTGGIVAAPTTSLPEWPGGVRNWDYRYCWLRDATFTLYALLNAGYVEEASAWRDWLSRAAAGRPQDLQTLYGLHGERQLREFEIPWLPGYEGSKPVRVGNAAAEQLQIDVYGEVMDAMHLARRHGIAASGHSWDLQRVLLDFLEDCWRKPDNGIWEIRGEREHFTHSKVMAWVAFDRAVRAVRKFKLEGPVSRWEKQRDAIRAEILRHGLDERRGVFVQRYGSADLDASLLMMPLVGFLPAGDRRMRATIEAIESDLKVDGLVRRYQTETGHDGLPGPEGAFLPCSFWLVDNLALLGRKDDATVLFEQLLGIANDVGLMAEEYDPNAGRMLGNFPQAFTHVALINSARNLSRQGGPCEDRAHDGHDHQSA